MWGIWVDILFNLKQIGFLGSHVIWKIQGAFSNQIDLNHHLLNLEVDQTSFCGVQFDRNCFC